MSAVVDRAAHHGAKFRQQGAEHIAEAFRRGRALPLVRFVGATKEEVAEMYLQYFRITR